MSREDEIIRLKSMLARYSGEDPETGLRNLRLFLSDCSREFARSQRTGEKLRIIALRPIFSNDARDFAEKLKKIVSAEALLGRIGASSFVILLPEENAEDTFSLLEDLAEKNPFFVRSRSLASSEIDPSESPRELLATLFGELDEACGFLSPAPGAIGPASTKDN